MAAPRVAVVADDLIWSTRLREQLRRAGARPFPVRDRAALEAILPDLEAVAVDLTARGYDGVELVRLAAASGRRVVAIGQHDDRDLRRRAMDAGAERMLVYRQLADGGGAAVLGSWLAGDPVPRPEPADAAERSEA